MAAVYAQEAGEDCKMTLTSQKDLQQLKNRFRDLAEKSFRQNIFTFTGFLGLAEQNVFWQMEKELKYVSYKLWGGDEDTDRKVVRFGSAAELGYEEPYDIVCIHISPLLEKFAEELSHRDYLGALMNLGIDRSTMGDIRTGDREGYLFCLKNVAPFICENLNQVKHTYVKCSVITEPAVLPREEPRQETFQVSSERIDAVTAKVYNQSRGSVTELFAAGKVYVDGRLCENNSRLLKPGETVNVRGYGKFIYQGIGRETRKGKLSIQTAVYR